MNAPKTFAAVRWFIVMKRQQAKTSEEITQLSELLALLRILDRTEMPFGTASPTGDVRETQESQIDWVSNTEKAFS